MPTTNLSGRALAEAAAQVTITDSDVVRFLRFQKRLHFVCPRKIVAHWWECDCMGVTDSGFWHEVEVKHSVADFKKDFEKGDAWNKHEVLAWKAGGPMPTRREHKRYWMPSSNVNHLTPPNYFWFALTTDVFEAVKVPDYAGILVKGRGKTGLGKIKEAPRLHSEKASPRFIEDVGRALEYRLYDALDRIDDLRKDYARALVAATGKEKKEN